MGTFDHHLCFSHCHVSFLQLVFHKLPILCRHHVYPICTSSLKIPSCIMVKCNLSLYQQLKIVQTSKNLTEKTFQSIRKSVFRAKLTLSITGIFIIGSMIMWLPTLPYELIHWKPEEFHELESDAVIFVILGGLVYVINCSSNYFVYKYLEWLEKKVKKPKSQFHTDLSKDTTNPTNLSSSA